MIHFKTFVIILILIIFFIYYNKIESFNIGAGNKGLHYPNIQHQDTTNNNLSDMYRIIEENRIAEVKRIDQERRNTEERSDSRNSEIRNFHLEEMKLIANAYSNADKYRNNDAERIANAYQQAEIIRHENNSIIDEHRIYEQNKNLEERLNNYKDIIETQKNEADLANKEKLVAEAIANNAQQELERLIKEQSDANQIIEAKELAEKAEEERIAVENEIKRIARNHWSTSTNHIIQENRIAHAIRIAEERKTEAENAEEARVSAELEAIQAILEQERLAIQNASDEQQRLAEELAIQAEEDRISTEAEEEQRRVEADVAEANRINIERDVVEANRIAEERRQNSIIEQNKKRKNIAAMIASGVALFGIGFTGHGVINN